MSPNCRYTDEKLDCDYPDRDTLPPLGSGVCTNCLLKMALEALADIAAGRCPNDDEEDEAPPLLDEAKTILDDPPVGLDEVLGDDEDDEEELDIV